jgi:glycine/sarcosine N-methyltransferase
MDFYSSVNQFYDFIFPLNKAQIRFIQTYLPHPSGKVLDVGCATGSLALELAVNGLDVHAFDINQSMVEQAQSKMNERDVVVHFTHADMLKMNQLYQAKSFDAIVCFGNTLVHLPHSVAIRTFLQQTFDILNAQGVFMLQILNYNYILNQQITTLPLIENEIVRFERSYVHNASSELRFRTQLFIKSEDRVVKNEIGLFPINRLELEQLLHEVGFSKLDWYGSFLFEALEPHALPLIVVAS